MMLDDILSIGCIGSGRKERKRIRYRLRFL